MSKKLVTKLLGIDLCWLLLNEHWHLVSYPNG